MNIYEITEEYAHLQAAVENGEITDEEFDDMLGCMDFELESKAEGYCYVVKNAEATAEAIGNEIKRLQAAKKRLEKRSERLKARLLTALITTGKEKIKAGIFALKVRTSERTVITDESAFYGNLADKKELYSRFVRTKTTAEPNLTEIKAAIKKGEKVAGAAIIENRTLQTAVG